MAVEAITQSVGFFSAGENMEANNFHSVKFNSFERWQLSSTGETQGIIVNAPRSGSVAHVVVFGVTKATLGGAVIAGRSLVSDTTSRFIEGTGGRVISLENGNVGDIVSVFISVTGGLTLSDLEDAVLGVQYDKLIDEVSTTLLYIGEADPTALQSEAKWRIKRIQDIGNDTEILWANDDARFVHIWDDRASLTYA